jgi:hypothetical protein
VDCHAAHEVHCMAIQVEQSQPNQKHLKMIDLVGLLIVINIFLNLVTNYGELVLKVLRERAGIYEPAMLT